MSAPCGPVHAVGRWPLVPRARPRSDERGHREVPGAEEGLGEWDYLPRAGGEGEAWRPQALGNLEAC